MEPNVFMGYPERGIACSLSPPGHEQYPFDSMGTKIIQPMVFTRYPNEGIAFFLGFVKLSKDMIWSQTIYGILGKGDCMFIEYFVL
jgi:hypothetical protein